MILGMTLSAFTLVHIVISVIGIGSGLLVMYGLLIGKRLDGATAIFLVSTVATSVTGFGFPFDRLLPSHKVGILSLLVLAVAIVARYIFHLAGAWRGMYVVSAAVALYLNVFVLVVQLFEKVPALRAMAPTQKEPPIPGRTTCCSRALRRACIYCSEEVPDRTGQRGLIEAVSCSPRAATRATRKTRSFRAGI